MMHTVAAVVAWVATTLYWFHAGQAVRRVPAWEAMVRVGLGGVLLFVAVAFIDLAVQGADFEWRHWLVLSGLVVVVGGYAVRYLRR